MYVIVVLVYLSATFLINNYFDNRKAKKEILRYQEEYKDSIIFSPARSNFLSKRLLRNKWDMESKAEMPHSNLPSWISFSNDITGVENFITGWNFGKKDSLLTKDKN